MRCLLQRVTEAQVRVNGEQIGAIRRGLVALAGFMADDGDRDVDWMVRKMLGLRIFPDARKPMNRSVLDVEGGLLLVPQFTLYADVRRGMRPSFSDAAPVHVAEPLFQLLVQAARARISPLASGLFGANMQVQLINDGPATFLLDSRE